MINNPIPPQRASYSDQGSSLFNLPWYLYLWELGQAVQGESNGVTINGQVVYY